MTDEEFDMQMQFLKKGLSIFKERGPLSLKDPLTGEDTIIDYESYKKMLDLMNAIVSLSRKLQSH